MRISFTVIISVAIMSCQGNQAQSSQNHADSTKKELTDWIETLTPNQFKEIEKFFDTMPRLSHTVKVINPKTKVESEVVLEGLTSFFG